MTTQPLSLWAHQEKSLHDARSLASKGFRSILIQLVTGTGKTRMITSAINNAISKQAPGTGQRQNVWFVVPRKELLWQSHEELKKWGIDHAVISGASKNFVALQNTMPVLIWSRDTLIRRIRSGKINKWANVIIFDECHIALDQQVEIKAAAPDRSIFLGLTATPERLDGRGLNEMWDSIVTGPQMQWFVDNEYLKRPWVMSIPPSERLQGLSELKRNKSGDVNTAKLIELYKARAGTGVIYGNEIEHYRKFGDGRSFLAFVRSVDQADTVAAEFTEAGFPCESIDGTMSDKVRKRKIKDVEDGRLLGLTTVDLCTYGLDVPRISCAILMRPTDSIALFFQMIGRILRWDGERRRGLILDHVGNCDDRHHGHPLAPRVWNFEGRRGRDKIPDGAVELIAGVDKCPICWDLIINGKCRTCGAFKEVKSRKPLKQVDGWLVEIEGPTPMAERPPENRRYYQDMINTNVDRFRAAWYVTGDDRPSVDVEAVKNLLEAATDLAWPNAPVAVYKRLRDPEDKLVNVSLLKVIAEIKGYNPYWIKRKREDFEHYRGTR